jgi:hypothetical protein
MPAEILGAGQGKDPPDEEKSAGREIRWMRNPPDESARPAWLENQLFVDFLSGSSQN